MSSNERNDLPGRDNEVERDRRNAELADRLEKLNSRIGDKKKETEPDKVVRSDKKDFGLAFRLSSEFIAGIVVGAVIGYAIDTFFGTSPWGMIVFVLLGFGAAILNVMRASGMVAESHHRLHKGDDRDTNPTPGAKKK